MAENNHEAMTGGHLSREERRRAERERQRGRAGAGGGTGRSILLWLGSLAVLAVLVWVVVAAARKTPTGPNAALVALADQVVSEDWFLSGSATSTVKLVEYSDFQCPACASYAPSLELLAAEFGSDLAIVYRHFPLRSIHPNAQLAAQAAEVAGAQGKFAAMAKLLFEKQSEWSERANPTEQFTAYARALGLNLTTFATDLNSAAVKDAVDEDFASAVRHGLGGTPTFFLNGQQLASNPRTDDEFRALIQSALDESAS